MSHLISWWWVVFIPTFWRALLIFKSKADEMVTASRGKESNSYFSDITK